MADHREQTGRSAAAQEIAANCLGVRARTIGRAVSAIYEESMREHGVTMPQVNIMALVGSMGSAAPGFIAETLAMEKSTVSRNVDRLLDKGWLATHRLEDGRRQELVLTAAGAAILDAVRDGWRKANDTAAALLGDEGSAAIRSIFRRIGNRSI